MGLSLVCLIAPSQEIPTGGVWGEENLLCVLPSFSLEKCVLGMGRYLSPHGPNTEAEGLAP